MNQKQGQSIIIGSRGAAGHAPENTMTSFEAAVRLGVDAVRFGVQFTSDGVPVVFEHETLLEMAGVGVRVEDYTASVLGGTINSSVLPLTASTTSRIRSGQSTAAYTVASMPIQ